MEVKSNMTVTEWGVSICINAILFIFIIEKLGKLNGSIFILQMIAICMLSVYVFDIEVKKI